MYSYSQIFQNPNWFVNLLLLCVLAFIPIVNQLVLLGYQYEIIEVLHRRRRGVYPDFDFGRFADYLMRGVWPFLVNLIASFVLVPVTLIVIYLPLFALVLGAIFGKESGMGEETGMLIGGICMVFLYAIGLTVLLALQMLMIPLQLRAGLSQEFGAAFDFGWSIDFVKKMWKEMIIAGLFLMVTYWLLAVLGLLLFCVGIFLVVFVVFYAYTHLLFQAYEIYLSRGGVPIPLKEGR